MILNHIKVYDINTYDIINRVEKKLGIVKKKKSPKKYPSA